jgi:glycoprotein endo-alpha-1,2-mannosidase
MNRQPIRLLHLFCALLAFRFVCLLGVCEPANPFFSFVQDQSARQHRDVPHEVLALYYGWYGEPEGAWKGINTNTHQIANAVRYPAKGPYDSHNRETIARQIDEAKKHGITGFIISWFGTGPEAAYHEKSLQLLIEEAERKGFKVSILWEQAPGEAQHQIDRAVAELSYALGRYGKSSSWLKVDAKPVICTYERVHRQIPMVKWPEIIQRTRAKAGDFVLIADGYHGQENADYLFDGVGSFDFEFLPAHLKSEPAKHIDDFRKWAEEQSRAIVRIRRNHGRIAVLALIPGFDNTKSSPARLKMDRADGQPYRVLWESALLAKPDWIVVSSWNEWPEGTEIEPSLEFGDKYLQITAEYSKRFLTSPTIPVSAPVAPPKLSPGMTLRADTLLEGRTIGIMKLGRFSDPEFWLHYCGATVRELTWDDLIDPTKFNPRTFPLVICVGNEHYKSSVKRTDDVTFALMRYLREGGFLVSLPVEPWPFLYDDSRKGVAHAISDTLGLAVTGWEASTFDTHPQFYVNTKALHGLPATATYPITGSFGWTGTTTNRALAKDLYGSLVQLKDQQGRIFGDGISYIQHRTPTLSSGQTLYVWARMPEVLGRNEFYISLYQFISTRLKPLPKNSGKGESN